MRIVPLLPLVALCAVGTPASAATVTGEAKVLLGGGTARCVGVALIPRTAQSEQAMIGTFGSAAASTRTLTAAELRNAKETANFQRSTEARCGWKSGYRFNNVAPGEYFVLLHARGGKGNNDFSISDASNQGVAQGGFREQAVLLMQPVTVAASGRLVQADFRHKS